MARAKVTIVGLYNYDERLFDNLSIPAAISKTGLIYNILERCGDLPVLYPDWGFMQMMIGVWSNNCRGVIDKLLATTQFEYNPINNYDRKSTITRQRTATSTTEAESNSTSENIGAQTSFNSDSFKNTDKSNASAESTDSATSNGNENEQVVENTAGNIGVTSTQDLIEQERKVARFNIYDVITEDFKNRFCIEIY